MRSIGKIVLAGGVAAALAVVGRAGAEARERDARVRRGEYMVRASGCNDCHTPLKMGGQGPEPDVSRMMSGHPEDLKMPPVPRLPPGPWVAVVSGTNTAWAGPWGVSFTSNLTPDAETGLGRWTEREFIETIRSGRHLGRGRQLLPPMPMQALATLTDDDLGAVFAYLQTIPAIRNRVPDPLAATTAAR